MRIRHGFEEFFCLRSNLSNDGIISALRPDLKTSMDFRGLVWKRAWKITFFGLKSGQDLENRGAHPHQDFPGVPPGAYRHSQAVFLSHILLKNKTELPCKALCMIYLTFVFGAKHSWYQSSKNAEGNFSVPSRLFRFSCPHAPGAAKDRATDHVYI